MRESETMSPSDTDVENGDATDLTVQLADVEQRLAAARSLRQTQIDRAIAHVQRVSELELMIRARVAERADPPIVAKLRADVQLLDDEGTANATEDAATSAEIVNLTWRHRDLKIAIAEEAMAKARRTLGRDREHLEEMLRTFAVELLEPLLDRIDATGKALNGAWSEMHDAKGTPYNERREPPYGTLRAQSAVTDTTDLLIAFAHGVTPRQLDARQRQQAVDTLRSMMSALKDPKARRAPNDPAPQPAQKLVL